MAVTDLYDICYSSSDTDTIGQRGTTLNLQIFGQCEHINFFLAIIMFILPTSHFFKQFLFSIEILDLGHDVVNLPLFLFSGQSFSIFGLGKRKVSTVVLQQQNSMCCVPLCYKLHSKSEGVGSGYFQ